MGMHQFCCEKFSEYVHAHTSTSPLAIAYAGAGLSRGNGQIEQCEDGTWSVNGCCGGGCTVVDDMRFCPFCAAPLPTEHIELPRPDPPIPPKPKPTMPGEAVHSSVDGVTWTLREPTEYVVHEGVRYIVGHGEVWRETEPSEWTKIDDPEILHRWAESRTGG